MQIQNTDRIHGPCRQRDMVYAAEHNGYHVRGNFPPPFGRGRSAQPLAKEGTEAGQKMGRQCAQPLGGKKQAATCTQVFRCPPVSRVRAGGGF